MGLNAADFDKVQHVAIAAGDDGIRLDRWFKRYVPALSFGQLSKMLRKGEVRIDGKRADGKTKIATGQELRIPPLSGRLQAAQPKPTQGISDADRDFMRTLILHEDDAVIALNKPAGLATQGGSGITRHVDGLLAGLVQKGAARPKLVHRLDKDTSGVLLLGKTGAAAAALTQAFRQRDAQKTYHAIVNGLPNPRDGRITQPIEKAPGAHGEKMVPTDTGKPAVTEFEVLDHAGGKAALVELYPQTGRTHQLRVHMAYIGCPIVGDGKYGGKDAFLTGAISRKLHLHAKAISLSHPDGGAFSIEAPHPEHFSQSLDVLGLDASARE
ncbi:MAG: RluA family pseudouridine synthase [Pseudomonadota bacterium]